MYHNEQETYLMKYFQRSIFNTIYNQLNYDNKVFCDKICLVFFLRVLCGSAFVHLYVFWYNLRSALLQ